MYSVKQRTNAKFLDIPVEIIALLENRGITEDEEILDFLIKDYSLKNPFDLSGMMKSVKIISHYIKEGKKIIIMGDFDADGILGSVSLYLFLERLNANVEVDFPQREDGHGISEKRVQRAMDNDGDLIISVDNGISSFEGASYCFKNKIPLIITDHHELPEKLPKAYSIINPKIKNKELMNLSGAGVAFYLIRAIKAYMKSDESVMDYLVLTTLATIADMVDLKGDNRIIVNEGVRFLFETQLVGFNYLLDEIDFYSYPNAQDIAFKITPIINSAGRLNLSEKVVSLLKDTSMNAYSIVKEVLNINEMRKDISDQGLEEAKKNLVEKDNIIFSKGNIDIGFTGLIANKLLGDMNKTTIIMSGNKGSIRTKDSNAKKIIESIDYLKGGGHRGAAGFHIEDDTNIDQLIIDLDKFAKKYKINEEEKDFELELDFDKIREIKKYINLMEPFGMGNPMPLIKTKVKYSDFKVYKKEHLIISHKEFKYKMFFARDKIDKAISLLKEDKLFVIGELSFDLMNVNILISDIV